MAALSETVYNIDVLNNYHSSSCYLSGKSDKVAAFESKSVLSDCFIVSGKTTRYKNSLDHVASSELLYNVDVSNRYQLLPHKNCVNEPNSDGAPMSLVKSSTRSTDSLKLGRCLNHKKDVIKNTSASNASFSAISAASSEEISSGFEGASFHTPLRLTGGGGTSNEISDFIDQDTSIAEVESSSLNSTVVEELDTESDTAENAFDTLKEIRVKNVNRVVIGTLNINSLAY